MLVADLPFHGRGYLFCRAPDAARELGRSAGAMALPRLPCTDARALDRDVSHTPLQETSRGRRTVDPHCALHQRLPERGNRRSVRARSVASGQMCDGSNSSEPVSHWAEPPIQPAQPPTRLDTNVIVEKWIDQPHHDFHASNVPLSVRYRATAQAARVVKRGQREGQMSVRDASRLDDDRWRPVLGHMRRTCPTRRPPAWRQSPAGSS